MLKIIKALVAFIILTLLFVFSLGEFIKSVHAGEFNLVELDEVKLQYKDFFPGGSDPLITQNGLPDRTLGKEVNFILNTNVLDYGFFNNTVNSKTDEIINSGGRGQFRSVAWSFQLGIRLATFLNVSYAHKSEHLLDHVYSQGRFPVNDSIMFEMIFFSKQKQQTLFNF